MWSLDPDIHFLNHGSFGAAPRHVLAAQTRWREAMEREPVRFMVDELPGALMAARERLAGFVGAVPQRLTFVENATARVPWPLPGPEAVAAAFDAALAGGARLAIVDHVFAPLAAVSPLEEIVRLCRARGVPVLVDGAHAPGMLPLELDALAAQGMTWYVGNCHKWLCAPKGCAFLYATPEGQRDLHPTVVSNFYGEGYEQEFAWPGTHDPSARLAVTAALAFIEALGVDCYQSELVGQARAAAELIADAWRVAPGAALSMCAAMVSLPLPVDEAGTEEAARRWRRRLLDEHRIEVPIFPVAGRLWARLSAQVYNELSDYEALARVFG
ncbi:MAG: aminotransferase class V-fold PLP-dependent enzyme [Betaproteobacteria bacterium]|nr:aminotransferase class V-fold PLP-dependent enzyme [Betaproteobacteria bacterium]